MIDIRKEYKWIDSWIQEYLDNLGSDIETRIFKAEEVAMMMQIYTSEVVKENELLHSVSNQRELLTAFRIWWWGNREKETDITNSDLDRYLDGL